MLLIMIEIKLLFIATCYALRPVIHCDLLYIATCYTLPPVIHIVVLAAPAEVQRGVTIHRLELIITERHGAAE